MPQLIGSSQCCVIKANPFFVEGGGLLHVKACAAKPGDTFHVQEGDG